MTFPGFPVKAQGNSQHHTLQTKEYIQTLAIELHNKFNGSHVSADAVINVRGEANQNVNYQFAVFVTPMINMMFEIGVTGSIHGSIPYPAKYIEPIGKEHRAETMSIPFELAKDVFPDDDPNIVANWIYDEVSRRFKQFTIEFMRQHQQ